MASDVEENRRLLAAYELPECDGPKLKAFQYRNSPITWIEQIGQPSDQSVAGGQGYVFKVEIRSRIYALKVFKFFKPSTYRSTLGPIREKNVQDLLLGFHTDPFYAECRAYAQIKAQRENQGLKRKDIADCYGFLALKKADEEILEDYGVDLWWDIPPDDEFRQTAEGSPARALVKEYIEEDVDMDERTRKHMLTSIKWLNRNKILVNDIHAGNFKGGYLLDFGQSWTKPHCLWDNTSRHRMRAVVTGDLYMFEEMIEDMGLGIRRSPRLLSR